MSEKSTLKREYILEKAAEVFAEKGFATVTMKDIVEACDISRGGLYLYYSSTAEIFLDVLAMESEDGEAISQEDMENATASDLILMFIKEQKKEILRKSNNLGVATYEYFFENKVPKKENTLKKKFDLSVKVLERIVEYGIDNGEFYDIDAAALSRNMMYVFEGLKVSALTAGVSEKVFDQEVLYILNGLIPEEDE